MKHSITHHRGVRACFKKSRVFLHCLRHQNFKISSPLTECDFSATGVFVRRLRMVRMGWNAGTSWVPPLKPLKTPNIHS